MSLKVCANCGNKNGPYHSIRMFNDSVWVCMNTKKSPNRITECVERREKSDNAKYKELMHPYA